MCLVKFIYKFLSVCHVLGGFPRVLAGVKALPFDEVLQLSSIEAAVQDFIDLVFFLAIDFDGVRRGRCVAVDAIPFPRGEPVDVEHGVDLERRREFEAIIPITEFFQYLVWAELPRAELWGGLMNVNILGVEPYLIADFELSWGNLLPGNLCFAPSQCCVRVFETFPELFDTGIGRGHIALPPDGDSEVGLVTVENFERGTLEGELEAVVDDKFADRQKRSPVILALACEHTEVLFNLLVHALCLPICLGMVSRGELAGDPQLLIQRLDEFGGELWSTIGDDTAWESVESEDVLQHEVGDSISVDCRVRESEVCLFGVQVHERQDGIVELSISAFGRW